MTRTQLRLSLPAFDLALYDEVEAQTSGEYSPQGDEALFGLVQARCIHEDNLLVALR